MTLQETVLNDLQKLTIEEQKEVLDFIQFLQFKKNNQPQVKKQIKGLWKQFNLSISEADIAEARQEMWGNFPREIDL
ncbi:MAG: DUF2281 domain-containing protein [Cyanobacterium sp. T60_A2020_053]|nr:DUF2281 domain-containing protein [Cyanobacterium sp. T60_A2020_053]